MTGLYAALSTSQRNIRQYVLPRLHLGQNGSRLAKRASREEKDPGQLIQDGKLVGPWSGPQGMGRPCVCVCVCVWTFTASQPEMAGVGQRISRVDGQIWIYR